MSVSFKVNDRTVSKQVFDSSLSKIGGLVAAEIEKRITKAVGYHNLSKITVTLKGNQLEFEGPDDLIKKLRRAFS